MLPGVKDNLMPNSTQPTLPTTADLRSLLNREIQRCLARIAECGERESALGPQPDFKLRAAIDRDRDRAFISLRRAASMLKQLPPEPQSEPEPETTGPEQPRQIARNAPCPCNSGQKFKRCCGRAAPPLPLRPPSSARRVPQHTGPPEMHI